MKTIRSPFKFLDAFTLADRADFFGRDKEIEQLYDLVFKTPLLLIYGASGTGKTSLIQCGLASKFDGTDWLPLWIRRDVDINRSLQLAIDKVLPAPDSKGEKADEEKAKGENTEGALPNSPLGLGVQKLYQHYLRPVFLIFDQFEELFIFGTQDERSLFVEQIKTLLDNELPCTIIIAIREEYLGQLYSFEKQIPELFDFRMRVEPMDAAHVKEVLDNSFHKFNITVEPPKDARFEQIIENVSRAKSGIELPYLQVYLDMLYREDFERTYPEKLETQENEKWLPLEFTNAEIKEFGTIDNVLEKFLYEQQIQIESQLIKEYPSVKKDVVRQILDAFVSDEGTKRPISYRRNGNLLHIGDTDQVHFPPLPVEVLTFCFETMERVRLIRGDGRSMELAHDSLAMLIESHRSAEERQRNNMKREIRSFYQNYLRSGEFLSLKQIAEFEDNLSDLSLNEELLQFFRDSQKVRKEETERELNKAKQEAIIEKARRQKSYFYLSIVIVFLGIALYEYWESNSNKEKAILNGLESKARVLAFKEKDYVAAIRIIDYIYKKYSIDDLEKSKVMYDIFSDTVLYSTVTNVLYEKSFINNIMLNCVAVSPNHKLVAFCGADSTIRVWNWEKNSLIKTLKGHHSNVWQVAFSNNGKKMATGDTDGNVIIWDVDQFKEITSYKKHKNAILSMKFAYNDKFICTGSGDSTALCWNIETGKNIVELKGHKRGVRALDISYDNRYILTGSWDGTAKLWNLDKGVCIKTYYHNLKKEKNYEQGFHKSFNPIQIFDVSFSKDNKKLLTCGDDGYTRMWETFTGKELKTIVSDPEVTWTSKFSRDDKYILTAGQNGVAMLWDANTGEKLEEYLGNSSIIYSTEFTSDGQYIITANGSGIGKVWKVRPEKNVFIFKNHKDIVTKVAYIPSDSVLFSGSLDSTIIRWNFENKAIDSIWTYQDPYDDFSSATIDSTTKIYAGGRYSADTLDIKNAYVFDFSIKQITKRFSGHTRDVLSVAISNDKTYALTGSWDMTAKLWSVKKGRPLITYIGHEEFIETVAFSDSNEYVITGSADKTIKVWETFTGRLVQTLKTTGRISAINMSPDYNYILSGDWNGEVRMWKTVENLLSNPYLPQLTIEQKKLYGLYNED